MAKDQKPSALPYDTETLLAGGFGRLADFEMWLRTASCEDTARLILGLKAQQAQQALWNAPVTTLLVRRFREFSVDNRFAVLVKLNADTKRVEVSGCHRIFGDLAEDALPRRAGDFLALKLPQSPVRDQAMGGVARIMAKTSLGEALDWLDAHQFGGKVNYETLSARRSAVSQAASTNPAAVAQLLLDRPGLFENSGGPQQVKSLFETWARKDPAGAAAWLETHPLPAAYQEMAEPVLASERLRRESLERDDRLTNAWSNG
ncbi:MAG: hypothetical protein EOP86_26445 [Verrucomicrobiaceae bacterium]|nr:MAG: hypothetical protein EOP86_26445 [Verrucomicrobiaceae bacterium]